VAVLPGDAVEATIVNTHSQRTVSLLDKEDRGAIWGRAGLDEFFGK